MKKAIHYLIILACVICLFGCSKVNKEQTANFYYIRSSYVFGKEDGVMMPEVRNTVQYAGARETMSAYMGGPQDPTLVSPFPSGTMIIDFYYVGDTLHVVFNSHLATIAKSKQVLACTCFARTAIELTGVKAVHFETDSSKVARMDPITISSDSYLLYDNYGATAATE